MVAALILAAAFSVQPLQAAQPPVADLVRIEWQRKAEARDRELAQSATSYLNVNDIARLRPGDKVFLDLTLPHEKARWLRTVPKTATWVSIESRGSEAVVRDVHGTKTSLKPAELWRAPNGLVVRVYTGQVIAAYLHDPRNLKVVGFRGLARFNYDPAWAIEAQFEPAFRRQPWVFATTQGLKRNAFKAGKIAFDRLGKRFLLDVFIWDDDSEDELFVPFRDKTDGVESYAGGRYVDVRLPRGLRGGSVTIDFNDAYNPLCARSHLFDCVIYSGNKLPFAVRAGEKAPPTATGSAKRI